MEKIFSIFENYPVTVEFSTREDGTMRREPCGDPSLEETAQRNRSGFFRTINIEEASVVGAILAHSTSIADVSSRECGTTLVGVDALMTHEHGVFLSITAGDCLPVFLYDGSSIALIHAGWRGLAQGILENTIRKFPAAEKIIAGIGPAICIDHYEVRMELLDAFSRYPQTWRKTYKKFFLDLKGIAVSKLLYNGVRPENIEVSYECTFGLPQKYFSYRRDKPTVTQTMLAVFGMTA